MRKKNPEANTLGINRNETPKWIVLVFPAMFLSPTGNSGWGTGGI